MVIRASSSAPESATMPHRGARYTHAAKQAWGPLFHRRTGREKASPRQWGQNRSFFLFPATYCAQVKDFSSVPLITGGGQSAATFFRRASLSPPTVEGLPR